VHVTILSSVSCPALQYFSTLSHRGPDFPKKKSCWRQNVFWISLQRFYEIFFVLSRIERDMIKNVYCCSRKVSIVIVWVSWNLNFLTGFSKNTQTLNLLEIHTVGAKLFDVDRWTAMVKPTVTFRNFANMPKRRAVLHLLITKCALKRGGICSFCNVDTCILNIYYVTLEWHKGIN
jgi:hypothetical protein